MKNTINYIDNILDNENNIMTDKKYEIYVDIRKIINDLDPAIISFLDIDEYRIEINEIMQNLKNINDIDSCLTLLFKTFYEYFGRSFQIKNYKNYINASKKILKIKNKYNINDN